MIIYDDIDYTNQNRWNNFSNRVDRAENYKLEYLFQSVFIKNNWRIDDGHRDSLPICYRESIDYMNNKLQYLYQLIEY